MSALACVAKGDALDLHLERFEQDFDPALANVVANHDDAAAMIVDFAEAQSLSRCGAGADLLKAIVIPASNGARRVFLGAR